MRVVIVGSGVAGSEAGTWLGHRARQPLEIVEIECEPMRRFGGWGFQSFPSTEKTNLALRKMSLGRDPDEIFRWIDDPEQRETWPKELQELSFHADRPIPRVLIQLYVKWRRSQVRNDLVTYRRVTGEAMRVLLESGPHPISVTLDNQERILADRLIMASGSIAVKIPESLKDLGHHERIIIDPLTLEGHERRKEIPAGARVLILGTGLTGEEQANVLLSLGHTNLTILSRNGFRHYAYGQDQKNAPLTFDEAPDFLHAETPEEFNHKLSDFYSFFLEKGHSPEDILAALRPFWDDMRAELGGCYKAADRLRRFRRTLAVNSIGASFEVAQNLKEAEALGHLRTMCGVVESIVEREGAFEVRIHKDGEDEDAPMVALFDHIINAVGRNIIRHPIWEHLLADGIAKKHAGIGIRVSQYGQMMDAQGAASDTMWVVGMARAGDHALRHGYLGNTAFNVPQVRSHVYDTVDAMLEGLSKHPSEPTALPEAHRPQ